MSFLDRTILHCDINNFFASVEVLLNPDLAGKPIAVCGDPKKRRGIVLAKSEQAKKFGVKTGDVIWEAKQKCPDLIIVHPSKGVYSKYSAAMRDICYRFTDQIESFGSDECWLDVTGSTKLFGDGETIANRLRKEIKAELGLTVSIGVSFNKIFAKIGSDYKKPDATTVISRENYQTIVWPLPVTDMLYVGRHTRVLFEKLNIKNIGDLARFNETVLASHIGIQAHKLISAAHGEDDEPVHRFDFKDIPKSVGNGTTLPHDLISCREVEQVIYLLAEEVAYRLRKIGAKGYTVNLTVKRHDLEYFGAQSALREPTNSSITIQKKATEIFVKLWQVYSNGNLAESIRALRVSVSNLTYDKRVQLNLWDDGASEDKNDKLSNTFDKIRRKYGTSSIFFGNLLGSDFNLHFEVSDEFF